MHMLLWEGVSDMCRMEASSGSWLFTSRIICAAAVLRWD